MFRSLLRTLPTLSGNAMLACEINDLKNESGNIWSTYVRSASLQPLQTSLFNKRININLLEGSWEYDIKKFYNDSPDKFYSDNYTFIENDYQKTSLTEYNADTSGRNRDYEFGCKRISYTNTGYSFAFFAPIWISSKDDIPDFFDIKITFENDDQKTIRVYLDKESPTNYLEKYLSRYASKIDENAIYFVPNTSKSIYYGIDVLHGGFVGIEDSRMQQYIDNQTDIVKFDSELCNGFMSHNLVMKQILPLGFLFNVDDILNKLEKKYYTAHKIKIVGKYSKSELYCDFYDFDTNYMSKNVYEHKYDLDTGLDFKWSKKSVKDRKSNTITIFDLFDNDSQYCLFEHNQDKYKNLNKMTPSVCSWKFLFSNNTYPYVCNNSILYNNQKTMSYGQYPISLVNVVPSKYVFYDYGSSQWLTIGYAFNNYYNTFQEYVGKNNEEQFKEYYNNMKMTNISNWYSLVNQYDKDDVNNIILSDDQQIWSPIYNKYSYYKGILYNLSNIDGIDDVNSFGVFLKPSIQFKNEYEDIKNISNKILLRTNVVSDQNISLNKSVLYSEFKNDISENKSTSDLYSLIDFDTNNNGTYEYRFTSISSLDKIEKIDDLSDDQIYFDFGNLNEYHTYVRFTDDFEKLENININGTNISGNGYLRRFKIDFLSKTEKYQYVNTNKEGHYDKNNIFLSQDLDVYEANSYISVKILEKIKDDNPDNELINSILDTSSRYLLVLDDKVKLYDDKSIWPYNSVSEYEKTHNLFTNGYVKRIETWEDAKHNVYDMNYSKRLWIDANGIDHLRMIKDDKAENLLSHAKAYLKENYGSDDGKFNPSMWLFLDNIRNENHENTLIKVGTIAQLKFEIENGYPLNIRLYQSNNDDFYFYNNQNLVKKQNKKNKFIIENKKVFFNYNGTNYEIKEKNVSFSKDDNLMNENKTELYFTSRNTDYILDIYSKKQVIPFTEEMKEYIDTYNFQYYIYRDMCSDEEKIYTNFNNPNPNSNVKLNNKQFKFCFLSLLENVNSQFVRNDDDAIEFKNMTDIENSVKSVPMTWTSNDKNVTWEYNQLTYNEEYQTYMSQVSIYDKESKYDLMTILGTLIVDYIKSDDNIYSFIRILEMLMNVDVDSKDYEKDKEYYQYYYNLISILIDDKNTTLSDLYEKNINKYINHINTYNSDYKKENQKVFSKDSSFKLRLENIVIDINNDQKSSLNGRILEFLRKSEDNKKRILFTNLLKQFDFAIEKDNSCPLIDKIIDFLFSKDQLSYGGFYDILVLLFEESENNDLFINVLNWCINKGIITLYNNIDIQNNFSMIRFKSEDYIKNDVVSKKDPNLHIMTIQDNNGNISKKAYYLMSLNINNYSSYNFSKESIKLIEKINDVNLLDKDNGQRRFVEKIFNEIMILSKLNIFNKFIESIHTVMKPTSINQKIKYVATKSQSKTYDISYVDDDNSKLNIVENNVYVLENVSNTFQNIIFNRYFNYILPIFIKSNSFEYRFNKIYKDTNTIYDKYNTYASTENIYKYDGIIFVEDNNDDFDESHINVVQRFPYERKYFNDNSLYILKPQFEWMITSKMTYDKILECETDENTLIIFKKCLKTLFKKDTEDENEILFLYNQYEKSYKSLSIGVDFDNKEKLYQLKYIFTLK